MSNINQCEDKDEIPTLNCGQNYGNGSEVATSSGFSSLIVTNANANAAPNSDVGDLATTQPAAENETEARTCWICFASEEDNHMAVWVKPCKCRGTTKWVHQSCLYRWIDEKQKGNALRPVTCQQCQTEYIIVFPQMGAFANMLETIDNLIKRLNPFIAAGIFVGSIYWTAVTYGAVTFLQIVGHQKGLALMENGDPLVLLIGLPAIPVGLVLSRFIRWEDAVLRLIHNRSNFVRKFPLINFIIPANNEDEETSTVQNPATPALSDPVSATRLICGALLLPTISTIVGRIFFDTIDNNLHRTLLGGLTYITVKGILKIYLKHQQHNRKKKRRIMNYVEDILRLPGGAISRYTQHNSRHNHSNNAAPIIAETSNSASNGNNVQRSDAINNSFAALRTDADMRDSVV